MISLISIPHVGSDNNSHLSVMPFKQINERMIQFVRIDLFKELHFSFVGFIHCFSIFYFINFHLIFIAFFSA